jgi:fluoroacetyl-CoA thioesterase
MTMVSKTSSDAGERPTATTSVTVTFKDTVAAIEPTMPPVAATPFLVTIAEIACYRLVQDQLEPGQITVGSRVVIDHLGPSKVGATLLVTATLPQRDRKRFKFSVRIEDGERTIANVEHDRAAVSLQKIMSSLG